MDITILLGIIFFTYTLFCLITFDIYSKNKSENKISKNLILIIIYIYYSILNTYILNLILEDSNIFEKILQILIQLITCALILVFYYNSNIKEKNVEIETSKYSY